MQSYIRNAFFTLIKTTFALMQKYDVIVIGAGPAGLLAAGRAAELGAKVLILEKMRQEGRKLLITGKGRCNITNNADINDFITHIHPNGRFLRNTFSQFFSKDIIDLLERHDTKSILERGGRYFPASNKSADVLKALLKWVKELKVEIHCGYRVEKFFFENKAIKGVQANGEKFIVENVILATGGKSYPATGSSGEGYELAKQTGHSIVKPKPALVPLETESNIPKELHDFTLKNVNATVWVNNKKTTEKLGELTFMPFGLSGPIILTLSRFIVDELYKKNEVEISIDLKPTLNEQKLDNRLLRDLNENGKKDIKNIFRKWLPVAMIPMFIEQLGINQNKECHQITSKERKQIRNLLKNLRFKITNHRSFKEAIITAGGVPTNEISAKTMESKLIKGLYFAGELIDLDADTGGYNLQIAFSTGWMAGNAYVKNN
ncbi:NAD(P)/FAD-dependent oxidoreductase [Bacteroidota bacterium]